jgi:hypothetical protein
VAPGTDVGDRAALVEPVNARQTVLSQTAFADLAAVWSAAITRLRAA